MRKTKVGDVFRKALQIVERDEELYPDIAVASASDPTYNGSGCNSRPLVKVFYDWFGLEAGFNEDPDENVVMLGFMAAIADERGWDKVPS